MNWHRRVIAYSTLASWAWLFVCIVATVVVLLAGIESLYRAVLICDLIPLVCHGIDIAVSWRRGKTDTPEVAP